MRPLAVILIWVVILGGLALYMQSRHYLVPSDDSGYVIQPAPGIFTLEVMPTFDAQGGVDPYGETLDPQPSFTLLLRGKEIVSYEQSIQAGLPTTIPWDPDKWPLEVGDNEFFIEVPTPTTKQDDFAIDPKEELATTNKVYAVRLRLLRDGAEVDSKTLWSEPGKKVAGTMFITLDALPDATDEDHHAT